MHWAAPRTRNDPDHEIKRKPGLRNPAQGYRVSLGDCMALPVSPSPLTISVCVRSMLFGPQMKVMGHFRTPSQWAMVPSSSSPSALILNIPNGFLMGKSWSIFSVNLCHLGTISSLVCCLDTGTVASSQYAAQEMNCITMLFSLFRQEKQDVQRGGDLPSSTESKWPCQDGNQLWISHTHCFSLPLPPAGQRASKQTAMRGTK